CSTEITPSEQCFKLDARRSKIALGSFETVDHRDDFQHRAAEFSSLIHCLHYRAAGRRDVFEENHLRALFEQSVDALIGAVPLVFLAHKKAPDRLLRPASRA